MKLSFSEQSTIDYWDELYQKNDFTADCYRQRLHIACSWLESLNLPKKSKILDVGCGTGKFVQVASYLGFDSFGMDYSSGMVLKARNICELKNRAGIKFLQGNIETLPFLDESFDFITCLGVVSYLDTEDKAIKSLAKTLKPGGTLVISIVNKARLVNWIDLPLLINNLVKKVIKKTKKSNKESKVDKSIVIKTYFIPKFRRSLELSGFQLIKYKTVPWKLITIGGKNILPQKIAVSITKSFEWFSRIPFIDSFGGMCIFLAQKNP